MTVSDYTVSRNMESNAVTMDELRALRAKMFRDLEEAKRLFSGGGYELLTGEAALLIVDELIEKAQKDAAA